jgi:hypothetical protein
VIRKLIIAASMFAVIALPSAQAQSPKPRDIFESEAAALSFVTLPGAEWRKPHSRRFCCEISGTRFTQYTYQIVGQTRTVQIGIDAQAHLRQFEVRFPIANRVCLITPNTRVLAQLLMDHTEPMFASDNRSVNAVGSSADLVWPWTAFPSGPGHQFGKTQYYFRKMNGYCAFEIKRLAS